jgi:hypothetical protein
MLDWLIQNRSMLCGKAASVKQSADDVRKQRVSYIYGSINEKSGLTRDRIREQVEAEEGKSA